MKRALLIALATLFVASFAYASDYIGVFTDAGHTQYNIGPGSGTLYVYLNMVDHTVSAAEFKLVFPSCVSYGTPVVGLHGVFSIGNIYTDYSVAFDNCYFGWVECCHLTYTVSGSCPGAVVDIQRGDDADPAIIQVADCDGVIWEPVKLHGVVATESASWGTIKSLF